MQIVEGVARLTRGPENRSGADDRIKHPGGDGAHSAGGGLEVGLLTGAPALAVERADGLTEQGMPSG